MQKFDGKRYHIFGFNKVGKNCESIWFYEKKENKFNNKNGRQGLDNIYKFMSGNFILS